MNGSIQGLFAGLSLSHECCAAERRTLAFDRDPSLVDFVLRLGKFCAVVVYLGAAIFNFGRKLVELVTSFFDTSELRALVLLGALDLFPQLCKLLLAREEELFFRVKRRRRTFEAKPAKVARGVALAGS